MSLPQFGAGALGLARTWGDSSFPHGCPGRAAAGTATGRDSSPGAWWGQCLRPTLHCSDVLSRHPVTSGPEDLLPTSVLPGAPPSLHVHGSEGDSLSLSATAQVSLRSGLGRLCLQRLCVGAETRQQKPSRICRARGGGKPIHPHVQRCQVGCPLSSDPAFSSATSLVGQHPHHKAWLALSQLLQRHHQQLRPLSSSALGDGHETPRKGCPLTAGKG